MAAEAREPTPPIDCAADLFRLGDSLLLALPDRASKGLPSRGQVAVRGAINGQDFQTVVEPDGCGGHWVRVGEALQQATGLGAGDTVRLTVEVTRDWPEPQVPPDLAAALDEATRNVQLTWEGITPMARWEWVRWVNATRNPATRQRRVEVSISKLNSGKRRPCCFDLSACTDPDLSKNGKLLPRSVSSGRVRPR
ncbi:MAG: YdeI/OmpD-associated family protein [Nocardioidaceae bacterium]